MINHTDNDRPDLTLTEKNNKSRYHGMDLLVFSKDSKTFISGNRIEGHIRLWDAITGQQLGIFEQVTQFKGISKQEPEPLIGISVLAFSPNGNNIACGHDDNTIRLYDIVTKTEVAVFTGHQERIITITYSPDSSKLVSVSTDNTIHFWDVNKKREISKLTGTQCPIVKLAFSPDGKILASVGYDGTIRFLDPISGRELKNFATGHIMSIIGLAFTKENKILVSAAQNGSVQKWDVMNGILHPSPNVEHYERTKAFAFSADATLYASHGEDVVRVSKTSIRYLPHSETHLWSLTHGKNVISLPHSYGALAFSPDNKLLAACNTKTTSIWNIQKRQELFNIDVRQFFMHMVVRFSPDGKTFTTGGMDGEVHIWDVNTGIKLGTMGTGLREYSRNLAYSPDNSILAVSYVNAVKNVNNHLKLWNLVTKKEMYTLLKPKDNVRIGRIGFSPDGKTLLVTTQRFNLGEIRLFDVESGMPLPPILTGHTLEIKTLAFSHDGKTLATGSADGTILLWDWDQINKQISIGN